MAYTNAAAGSIADLLAQARPPFAKTIQETDRAAGSWWPTTTTSTTCSTPCRTPTKRWRRQGIYGDFFSFYLCDIVLKLNGKGGQPVYVKVAGQSTGRCAPQMKPFSERNQLVIGAIGLGLTVGIVRGRAELRQAAVRQPEQASTRRISPRPAG